MLNSINNLRKSPIVKYLVESTFYAGVIFSFIYFLHESPSEKIREIKEWRTSKETTTDPGIYVNNWHIPVQELKPGKLPVLPYEIIKEEENKLNLLVSDMELLVYVYSKNNAIRKEESKSEWNLEAIISPLGVGNDGKDGLTINGDLADKYLLKIFKIKGTEEDSTDEFLIDSIGGKKKSYTKKPDYILEINIRDYIPQIVK